MIKNKTKSSSQKVTAEDKWRVLKAARRSPTLRYSSKVVFWTLVDYFNFEDQYVYYHSEDQIAEDSSSTRRTVISSIKELEEDNWIEVERRKRRNNFYKINWKRKVDVKNLHVKVDVKDLPVDVKDLPVDVKDLPVDVKDLPVDVKDLPVDVKETAHKQVTLTSDSNKRHKQKEDFLPDEGISPSSQQDSKEASSLHQELESASSSQQDSKEASSLHQELKDDYAERVEADDYPPLLPPPPTTLKEHLELFRSDYPVGTYTTSQSLDAALLIFKRKVADGADPLAINRGVRIYKRQIKLKDTKPEFIKSPINYLEEEKWNDPSLNAFLSERKDKLSSLYAFVEANGFRQDARNYIIGQIQEYNDDVYGVEKTAWEREETEKIMRILHGVPLPQIKPVIRIEEEDDGGDYWIKRAKELSPELEQTTE